MQSGNTRTVTGCRQARRLVRRLGVSGIGNARNRVSEAGEGNRTLVISLEGYCSTIELHPRGHHFAAGFARQFRRRSPPEAADRSNRDSGIDRRDRDRSLQRRRISPPRFWPPDSPPVRRRDPSAARWGDARSSAPTGSGECRIRTCEGKTHQIYSLTPLTARETPLWLRPGVVTAGVVGDDAGPPGRGA